MVKSGVGQDAAFLNCKQLIDVILLSKRLLLYGMLRGSSSVNIISDYIGKSFVLTFKRFSIVVSLLVLFLMTYTFGLRDISLEITYIKNMYMLFGAAYTLVYMFKVALLIALKGTIYCGIIYLCKNAVYGYKSSLKDYVGYIKRNWLKVMIVTLVFVVINWVFQFILTYPLLHFSSFFTRVSKYELIVFVFGFIYRMIFSFPQILLLYTLYIVLEDRCDFKNVFERLKELVFSKKTVLLIVFVAIVQSVLGLAQSVFLNLVLGQQPGVISGKQNLFSMFTYNGYIMNRYVIFTTNLINELIAQFISAFMFIYIGLVFYHSRVQVSEANTSEPGINEYKTL